MKSYIKAMSLSHPVEYSEMQATMVEALKYLSRTSKSPYSPIIYNNLGIAYCQLEDYGRALQSYYKCLSLSDLPVYKLTVANNIGYVHMSSGNFEKAAAILKEAYCSPHIGDSLSLKARITDNLGYCQYKRGETEGVRLMVEGRTLREELNDDFGLITSNLHLGEALLMLDKKQAIKAFLKAESLAAKTNSIDDRLLALQLLSRHTSPLTAKSYSSLYFELTDSLLGARRKARNYFAEVKYNYKAERDEKLRAVAREAELRLRQSQLENGRLMLLIITLCITFLSAIIVYHIVRTARRNRWKAAYDTEVRISNRLHDELANDIHQAIVVTEGNDISGPINKSRLLDILELVYRQARAISRENSAIGSDDFSTKLKDLMSIYNTNGQKVLIKGIGDI
ncbi:MAG: tetratricopeptide repeat protein, partial [Pedobacter sp.]